MGIKNNIFSLKKGDTVTLKVGSNILAGKENGVNLENLKNIVNSIEYLIKLGLNVFLVSSGAVAVGRNYFEKNGIKYGNNSALSEFEKAFLFTKGWYKLMSLYEGLFEKKSIITTGTLLTHDNFSNNQEFENICEIFQENIKNKTLNIINENDVVSREELGFSDNDELSGLIAEVTNSKLLVILSDIDGIYENYGNDSQKLIDLVSNVDNVRIHCKENNSLLGTGGMNSKLNVMDKIMKNGTSGILCNGRTKNILRKIFEGKKVGKTFFCTNKNFSNNKKNKQKIICQN